MLLLQSAHAGDVDLLPHAWARVAFAHVDDDPQLEGDEDAFALAARIGLDAETSDLPVRGRVEVALLPAPALTDAWIEVSPRAWLSLRAGQFEVPFSIAQLACDTCGQLVAGPRIVDAVGLERELGADATLRVPWAGLTRAVLVSGVFNGEGPNQVSAPNQRYLAAQRLLLTPFGARDTDFEGTGRTLYLGVGGGWLYDLDGTGVDATESNTLGVEGQAAWSFVSAQAEYIDRGVFHADPVTADFHAYGWYAQLGSFVPVGWASTHVELVFRYEESEPTTAFGAPLVLAGELDRGAESQAVHVSTVGVNVYARGESARMHDIKLQASFAHPVNVEGAGHRDDALTIAATARF